MSVASRTPSLTPSPSPPPTIPVQPDHFYGPDGARFPLSFLSQGRGWLDPHDDPLAQRGIPVFKPTMDEFQDFESYVSSIESWGIRSGIVKVIPPKEWTHALPSLKDQLSAVKIRTPIEQHMLGRSGLFRQENIEKRRVLSVREWVELCAKDDYKAPGIQEIGSHARSVAGKTKSTPVTKKAPNKQSEIAEPHFSIEVVRMAESDGQVDTEQGQEPSPASPSSAGESHPHPDEVLDEPQSMSVDDKVQAKKNRHSRRAKEARLAERAALDAVFLETFDPHTHWLPPQTKPSDYTPEFCQKLERHYWRNCGLGKPAWYGADTQGSLCTDEIRTWNVAHLQSTLSRLLPVSFNGLPGVNTPYLYWGMWRATFAWHVEDMDLFSINFIHFGAPKHWYAVPQGRAYALEQTMRGYFPKDTSQCPQFLRHKSFLASPTLLAQSSCRPNVLVQHAHEFVITFPRGYHAGFNLGLNCAESVNFALESWLELGKKAQACQCVGDSVRIDVNQLLMDREIDRLNPPAPSPTAANENVTRKRKSLTIGDAPRPKKIKNKLGSNNTDDSTRSPSKKTLTLKLGPRPNEMDDFPCCLCVSPSREGLLRVHDPPFGKRDQADHLGCTKAWLAHEDCANVIPETWVDEIEVVEEGSTVKEKVVFGVDAIVKDRWNLNCSACTKSRRKAHGAPIQCTKGKCSKAFHVSCARNGGEQGIVFSVLKEVEKEVVLLDQPSDVTRPEEVSDTMQADALHSSLHSPDGLAKSVTKVSQSRVLKVIKKVDVQVLCSQHNPAVAAAKKASRQDKIRRDLLALPSMARIKIRVSTGVYEVSLIRVIEATGCVEVLWDRAIKREFKWGSIVFGSTDGQTVLQKPAQAEEPEHTFPSSTESQPVLATSPNIAVGHHSQTDGVALSSIAYGAHHPRHESGVWAYQSQAGESRYSSQQYHTGHYREATSASTSIQQLKDPNHYRSQLQWQRPYSAPRLDVGAPYNKPTSNTSVPSVKPNDHEQTLSDPAVGPTWAYPWSTVNSSPYSQVNTPVVRDDPQVSSGITNLGVLQDLSSLSALPPEGIAEILRTHPEIRDAVWSAIDKQRKVGS